MVWDPPGPVIVQGYSWLVFALLHSLRLEASLANHMAANGGPLGFTLSSGILG